LGWPGFGGWLPSPTCEVLPGGSRVATGRGGRLILARGADMVVVGPGGGLVLPDGARQPTLHQGAGELRYRLASGLAPPLRVTTAHLAIEASGAVFDLEAGADRTRVRALEGRLRVVAPDGARAIVLDPGDETIASTAAPWLVRRDGEAHAALVPATPEAPSASSVAPPPEQAVVPAGFLRPAATTSAADPEPVGTGPEPPASPRADPVEAPLAVAVIPPSPAAPGRGAEMPAADPRRTGFGRLTAGLLDSLPAQRLNPPRRHP
jgi:hypothetical protein